MIRKMELFDINRLAEIYFEIFTSSEWNYSWLTFGNTLRYLTDMYNSPKFFGYSLIIDDELNGGCFGDISDYFLHKGYYIKEVFLELKLQKKGLGRAFLTEIEADLQKKSIDNITLVTSKNIPAYGFYKKNGYVDSAETAFMLKIL